MDQDQITGNYCVREKWTNLNPGKKIEPLGSWCTATSSVPTHGGSFKCPMPWNIKTWSKSWKTQAMIMRTYAKFKSWHPVSRTFLSPKDGR